MNQAAVELAQKFRTAHRGLVDFIGSCSDEDWRTYCENEERAVGVVVHHLAFVQGKVVEMVDAALGGSRYSLTAEDVNQINRDHAKDFGDCSRPETIELLNRNGRRLSERVGELTDRQLTEAVDVIVNGQQMRSLKNVIALVAISHIEWHMDSVRAALQPAAAIR